MENKAVWRFHLLWLCSKLVYDGRLFVHTSLKYNGAYLEVHHYSSKRGILMVYLFLEELEFKI